MNTRRFMFRVVGFCVDYLLPIFTVLPISYYLHAHPEWLAVRVIKSAFYILAVFLFVSSVFFRRYALRRWGGTPTASVLSELVRLQGESVGFLVPDTPKGFMIVGLLAVGSAVLFSGGWLCIGFVFVAYAWDYFSRLSTPPLVAFFATSRSESQQLVRELARRLRPNRIMHLLALGSRDPSIEGIEQRTVDETKWRQSAESLMKLSRLIVFDCREASESLAYEAKVILTSNFVQKTIFIGDKEGRCKVFQQMLSDGRICRDTMVNVLPESMVLPAIHSDILGPFRAVGNYI